MQKKNKTAKQIREEQKQKNKEKWSKPQESKSKITTPDTIAQSAKEPVSQQQITPKIRSKKTNAKAAGLKSVFVANGQKLYTTSFGKGSDANLEACVNKDSVEKLNTETPKYDLKKNQCQLIVNGTNHITANVNVQKDVSVKQDNLGLKDKLETKIFGKTFDDTLHIQIAYNIMDIEKIIALYSTQAVYALDNVISSSDEDRTDLLGNIGTRPYQEFINYDPTVENSCKYDYRKDFSSFIHSPKLRYFGDVFVKNEKEKAQEKIAQLNAELSENESNDAQVEKFKKNTYCIIALIGQLRQWSFHSQSNKWQYWAYQLENKLHREFKDALDEAIDNKIEKVNNDFVNQNRVNLNALNKILSAEDKTKTANLYYKFLITKDHKDLGFSVKRLREIMLDYDDAAEGKEKQYDSVRRKINQMVDFLIFYHYQSESQKVEAELIVDSLRKTKTDDEKEAIYQETAWNLWTKVIMPNYGNILDAVRKVKDKDKGTHREDESEMNIDKIKPENFCYFSKLIYLLTYFIDGKEINDLLTTLIHKFYDIKSLIKTAKDMKIWSGFSSNYIFFECCYLEDDKNTKESDHKLELAKQLNVIKSFARMEKPNPHAKSAMYRDACDALWYQPASNDEFDKLFFKDESGELKATGHHGFRNFIGKNVIESNRFKYLVKYANIKNVRELCKNANIVKMVLNQMPESQITRYCESCGVNSLNQLTKIITDIESQFERCQKVYQVVNVKKTPEQQNCQAIIGLYLTVLYLIVKNLVNINSRYVIGFYFVERDANFFGVDLRVPNPEENTKPFKDYRKLAKYLLDSPDAKACDFRSHGYLRRKTWRDKMLVNYKNSGGDANSKICTDFRNTIDHLNAVRNANKYISRDDKFTSYYALYQYIVQKSVIDKNPDVSYANDLEKYHSYSKDFAKALCVPFAYNTPRFKNLSIEDLFDRNNETALTSTK